MGIEIQVEDYDTWDFLFSHVAKADALEGFTAKLTYTRNRKGKQAVSIDRAGDAPGDEYGMWVREFDEFANAPRGAPFFVAYDDIKVVQFY